MAEAPQPGWFWSAAQPTATLGRDDLHVWCVILSELNAHIEELEGMLSADEQREATKFQRSEHRLHFMLRHAILRILLAGYLGTDAHELQLARNTHGKPMLQNATAGQTVQFNASSSQDRALYAFTRERAVGVDVEYCRPFPEMEEVISRAFSPGEQEIAQSVTSDQRPAVFHRFWTQKEALAKASGEGFGIPLETLDTLSSEAASRWQSIEVAGLDGYAACVVTEAGPVTLSYFQWPRTGRAERGK